MTPKSYLQRLAGLSLAGLAIAAAHAAPSNVLPRPLPIDDQYVLGPDSQEHAGVPQGRILEFALPDTHAYPGFPRKWWLYTPNGYDGRTPLPLMVFLDGAGFAKRHGWWGAPEVLDNLIAKRQLPVMAGLFVDPGDIPLKPGEPRRKRPDGRFAPALNRETEYDTMSGAYADFLVNEMLPLARQHVAITDDPEGHGICGVSSGGIAAFTAAWHRPDQFRKVYTMVGSFANIRGGDAYPGIIAAAAKKPIRVFQQDGIRDFVNEHGSWTAGNRALAVALEQKGYDHMIVLGEGGHKIKHGASILPYALRWLWRDYPLRPIAERAKS